jgi:hypothetical protein
MITRGQRIGVTLLYLVLKPAVRVTDVLLPPDSDITMSSERGHLKLQTDAATAAAVYWAIPMYLYSLLLLADRLYRPLEDSIGADAAILYLPVIICWAVLIVNGPAWIAVSRHEATEVSGDD